MNAILEVLENDLTVTDKSFDREVLAFRQRVLVDLWAACCGLYRIISPLIHELAAENFRLAKVVKMNVDKNPETAARFDIAVFQCC